MSLNSRSLGEADAVSPANVEGAVTIIFNDGSKIEGRKPGAAYAVDQALAHHYCDVLGVARRAEPEPRGPQDRAMAPPPRGKAR